jgi:tetratricopeptide (TPR) repeat protein
MSRFTHAIRIFISFTFVFTTMIPAPMVRAQDIIASDDIAGGASVFVFRESRKKPQERSATARGFMTRGKAGSASRRKMNNHIATNWRKKKTVTRTGSSRARQTPAAQRRSDMAKTLTAAADKALDAKETDKAIAGYREALKNDPKNEDATSGLSEALTAKGIEVAGQTDEMAALVFLDEAVKLDPQNEIAFAKIGEMRGSS